MQDIQSLLQTLAGWKAPCSPSKVKGSGQPRPGEDFILSKSSRPRDKEEFNNEKRLYRQISQQVNVVLYIFMAISCCAEIERVPKLKKEKNEQQQ